MVATIQGAGRAGANPLRIGRRHRMQSAHHGMTIAQRRLLQFWLDAHGWRDRYVEINGELPMSEYGWEDELDYRDESGRLDTMSSVDALFDPPEE